MAKRLPNRGPSLWERWGVVSDDESTFDRPEQKVYAAIAGVVGLILLIGLMTWMSSTNDHPRSDAQSSRTRAPRTRSQPSAPELDPKATRQEVAASIAASLPSIFAATGHQVRCVPDYDGIDLYLDSQQPKAELRAAAIIPLQVLKGYRPNDLWICSAQDPALRRATCWYDPMTKEIRAGSPWSH